MPQFPEVDPDTLTQSVRNHITARMNVPALANGGSPNFLEVLRGWAEGITAAQNPSNAYFEQNDQNLYALVQQQQGGGGGPGLLAFNAAVPLQIGQIVYQISNDTVAPADFASISTGPAIGIVYSLFNQSSVLVQNLGSFAFNLNMGFGFLPLVPDTVYYVGPAGTITNTPSAPSGGYNQELGYAKNTLQLVFNIQEATLV